MCIGSQLLFKGISKHQCSQWHWASRFVKLQILTGSNGCGSTCKVWTKPRSHTRSRPPIQTIRKDLIQTFDPDLWKDIMYWWVDVWSSDGCMFSGFLLCSYSPCQATKQQTVVKPRCQAVRKLQLLRIQAVKLRSWHCCKLQGQPAKQPSCTLAACTPHAASKLQHTQTCGSTSGPVQTWIQTDPDPIHITTSSGPDHNQLCVKTCDCLVLSFLQTLGSQSINFGTHVNGSKSAYRSSRIRSVNTIPALAEMDLSTFPCDLWSSHGLM